ncbi:helix-turn-helix transcriptional regulator [Rufibacter sp. DG15C]|uniref:helix-turn-helix domain-containing protein n=1 Tax=Rufibacter sp. DG15C TaxID=1379909 RepID=UPI00082FE583|nr:helix-turn-helix transcriptional regulator [Rufibacter sp. DG15C]
MTDLLPRIKELLTWAGEGPAGFADAIGLPRPVMSHILAGRNKPSLEVVQKIIARFPEVQAQWLLLGAGEMLTSLDSDSRGKFGETNAKVGEYSDEPPLHTEQNANPAVEKVHSSSPVNTLSNYTKKKVKQVLLMYEDGTFESFYPQS